MKKFYVLVESDEDCMRTETHSFEAINMDAAFEIANKKWPHAVIDIFEEGT